LAEAWFAYAVDHIEEIQPHRDSLAAVRAGLAPDRRRDAIFDLAELLLYDPRGDSPELAARYSSLLDVARTGNLAALRPYQLRILTMAETRLGTFRVARYDTSLAAIQIRRATASARAWLESIGALRGDAATVLTRIDGECRTVPDRCTTAAYRIALREVALLVYFPVDSPYGQALRDETAGNRAKDHGDWPQAEQLFARGAGRLGDGRDPLVSAAAGRMWSGAAGAAMMSGRWEGVEPQAAKAIEAVRDLPPDPESPTLVMARSLIAEAKLVAGRHDLAWQLAGDIANELAALERTNPATLDLRARYRERDHAAPDPMEIRMLAGAMRYGAADRTGKAEILEALVTGNAWTRNSSLSDAIVLARQLGGDQRRRVAVAALLDANADLDRARRRAETDPAGSERAFASAQVALERAGQAAKRAGVRLDSGRASFETLRSALRRGEGFLFLHRSAFGDMVWGIDGEGNGVVDPRGLMLPRPESAPELRDIEAMFARIAPATFYANNDDLNRLLPALNAALAKGGPIPGWTSRTPPREMLERLMTGTSDSFGELLEPLKGRASHWVVAYNNGLDGVPLASLRMPGGRFFGTEFAYTVIPSIEALLVLRAAEPLKARISFLGVGDIPFRGLPCTDRAGAFDNLPADYAAQRDKILDRPCLEGTRDQLEVYSSRLAGTAEMLLGNDASEGRLRQYLDDRVGVLAFATHAVAADNGIGRWPALLLYPPVRPQHPGDDGRLLPNEALALGIRAHLVVLSACSTGVEDAGLGEEPLNGLARGFFLGGARSALVTRWDIRVGFSTAMNRAFATSLAAGKSRAEAIRDARKAAASLPGAREWDWAAFELIGEAGPLP
jgi:hypothetical protein